MNTEKKIIAEAIDLFRKNGYSSTSVNMISESCGISKGNLTYYFSTKDDLLRTCLDFSANYFKNFVLFTSFEESTNELDGLLSFLKNVKNWLYSDGKVIGCIFSNTALELRHIKPDLADISLKYLREFKEILKDKIVDGQKNKTINSYDSAENLIEYLFLGYEGAMIYSRIENSLDCFDFFIDRTAKTLKV